MPSLKTKNVVIVCITVVIIILIIFVTIDLESRRNHDRGRWVTFEVCTQETGSDLWACH